MSEPDDGERQLVVTGQASDLEDAVAKTVIGAGMGLRELHSRALTLEDVFLELTMEEAS
jgi:hypothetical protein